MKKSRLFMLVLFLFPGTFLWAQTNVLGKITDSETGDPLSNVSVIVKGTSAGASTASDGSYNLEVPQNGTVLVVSSVGYVAKEVTERSS